MPDAERSPEALRSEMEHQVPRYNGRSDVREQSVVLKSPIVRTNVWEQSVSEEPNQQLDDMH